MRGFLGGGFWGLVLGGVTVAGVSLVNPPPDNTNAAPPSQTADATDDAPEVAVADDPEIAVPTETSAAPAVPAGEDPVNLEDAPQTFVEPESDAAPDVDVVEAAPVTEPPVADDIALETQVAPEVVDADPEENDNAASQDADAESPGADISENVAELETPVPSEDVTATPEIDTAPESSDAPTAVTTAESVAQPDVPETAPAVQPTVASAATLDAPPAAPQSAEVSANADTPVLPSPQSQALDTPETSVTAPTQDEIADAPAPAPTATVDAPAAEDAPSDAATVPEIAVVADTTPIAPQAPLSPAPPAEGDAAPTTDDSGAVSAEADAEVVAIVEEPDARALPGGNTGVRVNRLSSRTEAEEVIEEEAPEELVTTDDLPEDAPAISRFAAVYENPQGLPEMSVVLTDDGNFDGAVAAVAGIPFPVSVMLNPSLDDAVERMNAYRAVGIEVGLSAALPPSATASDIAVYFEAALAAMPQAVAVLDAQGETQGGMDVIQQTIAALSEDGQGLITVPRGLNTAPRVAAENGVPAGLIYRDLDAEGQDAAVIKRFMDQAAFRARQDSGVIMLGRVQAETIAALIQWGAASRAGQVAVVPVSATLTAE